MYRRIGKVVFSVLLFFSSLFNGAAADKGIALILPGKGDSPYEAKYRQIGEYFREEEILPIYIPIDWKKLDPHDLKIAGQSEIDEAVSRNRGSKMYLFGFSLGAAIAMENADRYDFQKIILCSPSPLFAQDVKLQPLPIRLLMHFLIGDSRNFPRYPRSLGKNTVFLYGEHDSFLINRDILEKRRSVFSKSPIIIIPDTRHNIGSSKYLQAVHNVIKGL